MGVPPAQALMHPQLTQDDVDRLTEFWQTHEVSAHVQHSLLAKIGAGEMTDADRGDINPTHVETLQRNGNLETVATYPDGSILVTALQTSSGEFNTASFPGMSATRPASIALRAAPTNCQVKSGSGYAVYRNCNVIGATGTIQAGFGANYQIVNGGYDSITAHYAPYQQCAGVVCDTPYVAYTSLQETAGQPAQVTYHFRWTISAVSATGKVELLIANDRPTVGFRAKIGR
ncbi:hypothetical protein [Trueperella pyogenes]|uniref:hypothetical protein n=2 Tax=Trueperella pyogenes TaxID=1661 RepID=UPI00345D6880